MTIHCLDPAKAYADVYLAGADAAKRYVETKVAEFCSFQQGLFAITELSNEWYCIRQNIHDKYQELETNFFLVLIRFQIWRK